MKTSMPLINVLFSMLESFATLILAPLTLLALAGLVVVTFIIKVQLRTSNRTAEGRELWIRGFQRGA